MGKVHYIDPEHMVKDKFISFPGAVHPPLLSETLISLGYEGCFSKFTVGRSHEMTTFIYLESGTSDEMCALLILSL